MWSYRRNLERDLDRWTRAGWVTSDAAQKIRAEASASRGIGLAGVLAILASVLIGFAVFSFVGAHWEEIPRTARLGLLFGLVWAGYFAAGILSWRNMPAFSDAAVLFAVTVFGASIALISQMYHIDGHPPDGVMLWWLGALLAGVLLRSNPALALAMVLVCLWASMETTMRNQVFWPFLVGWALVAAAFFWQQWRPGLHIAGLAMTYFVVSLGFYLDKGHAHHIALGIGLGVCAFALWFEKSGFDARGLAPAILGYGFTAAYAGLFAMQFIENPERDTLVLLAAIAMAVVLGAIWHGLQARHRGLLWLGYIAFSIETLAVYYNLVGSMLSTSAFFLIAGLIVAALALLAWRLHERGQNLEAAA